MSEGGALEERLAALLQSWDASEVAEGLRLLERMDPEDKMTISLESLAIGGANVRDLTAFAGLGSLHDLQLTDCPELRSTRGVDLIAGLSELVLTNCPRLESLEDLPDCGSTLSSCRLEQCRSLVDLASIARLEQLRTVEFTNLGGLTDLHVLVDMPHLQWVKIEDFATIDEVEGDRDFTGKVADLSALREKRELTILHLRGQTRLVNVDPLEALSQLEVLALSGCTAIHNLDPLSGLKALQTLDLTDCCGIESLEPIGCLGQLRQLTLTGCRHVKSLRPLFGLRCLEVVSVAGCESIDQQELTALQKAIPGCEVSTAMW